MHIIKLRDQKDRTGHLWDIEGLLTLKNLCKCQPMHNIYRSWGILWFKILWHDSRKNKSAEPNRYQLWNTPVRIIIALAIIEVASFGPTWGQGLTTGPEKLLLAGLEMVTDNFSKIIWEEDSQNCSRTFSGESTICIFFSFFGYFFLGHGPIRFSKFTISKIKTCFQILLELLLWTKRNSNILYRID